MFLVAPGIRLLLLARETKQAPEFLGGLYFIGAALGISLRVLGASLASTDPELSLALNTVGHVGLASGTMAMAIFTQRVFHPDSQKARLLAFAMIAAILGTSAHTFLGGYVSSESSLSILATNSARILPTGWAFVESLRYWRAMRRRLNLGLADPVVTNRFFLWTVWTGSVSFLPLMALGVRLLGRIVLDADELQQIQNSETQAQTLGFIRAVFLLVVPMAFLSLTLSFFPPSAYLDRIRSRAATDGH